MSMPLPHGKATLRRHTLVTLTAAGWAALLTGDGALADEPLAHVWAARGWPLVVRRARPDETGIPLGMPLPPSAGKRRIALNVEAGSIDAVCEPPAFADTIGAAPSAWRQPLRELHALGEQCDVQGRVFGGLAWQTLTGEPYLTGTSDLDVFYPLPTAAQAARLLDGIAAIDARGPMRVDGELLRTDGAGVNWRELHAGLPDVAVKTADGVMLCAAGDFIGGAR